MTVPLSRAVVPQERGLGVPGVWVFGLLFGGVGALMGLLVGFAIAGDDPPPERIAVAAAPAPVETRVYQLQAVLSLPTEVPTPIPTLAPTRAATAAGTVNECDRTPAPGTLCRWPAPPTPTGTPYPMCSDALTGGEWCLWPTTGTTVAGIAK
jgi:hypothetical protein